MGIRKLLGWTRVDPPTPNREAQLGSTSNDDLSSRWAERAQWINSRGFRLVLDPLTGRYARGFDPACEYQFMRLDWDEPCVFRMADSHPAFNISGLYYREPA